MSTCSFPLCKRHAEKNGYCIGHRIYAASESKKPASPSPEKPLKKKIRQRVRKKSKKLATREREYKKIVAEMIHESNLCELTTPVCTGVAEGLHHMKGRGIHLLTRKFLKRACNACNGYVERHPAYALENGLSVSRHTKE